ncbi:MAG: hypothetical protein JJ964_00495 [Rhizobiales bacterium]|nr:hypothetical protein [Hyphomicrobiales bacterium]
MENETYQTVWERLGIEKTDDERAIKRAYAKQLKTIRPDEDPQHFQTLREARDEAIYLAKYDFDYEYDWEEEDDDPDAPRSEATSHEEDVSQPSDNQCDNLETAKTTVDTPINNALERALEKGEPCSDETYVLTLDEGGADTSHVAGQSAELVRDDEVTRGINDPLTLEEPLEEKDQSLSDDIDTALDIGSDASPDISFYDTDIDDVTYEQIDDEVENLMGPWSLWDRNEWKRFINRVREASFDISNYAEYEILRALGENLTEGKIESSYKRDARLNILYYLDEEYGWTQNDRRVYGILSHEQSEILMDYLRHGESGVSHGTSETYYDAFGFPLLTAEHFKDYLGKNDSVYEKYYQTSREDGRELKPSWCWPGFIFSPLWLAHRCNDGLEALAGMFYILALIILHYGLTAPSLIATLLASLIILSLHVLVGIYGRKLVVTTLANTLQDLHNGEPLSEEEKLKKLASIGRGGFKALFDFIVGMAGIGLIATLIYRLIL